MIVGETAQPSRFRRLVRPLLLILPLLAPLYGLGQRGLFESDEGRYAAVALAMLESGDGWIPRFDPDTPHLSKPPLLYWAIAASIAIFGKSEWAVRLPSVLGFWLGCVGVALAARALRIRPWAAVWIFASALPVAVASEIVSTDMLLTGLLAAAVGSWLSALVSPNPLAWRLLAGIAFGLAFLCKGPPALLPLIAMAAWRKREGLSVPLLGAVGWLAFAASALPWYLVVMVKIPEAGGYWLGYEFFARIFSAEHDRHARWYGFVEAYGGLLALGLLPWVWLLRPQPSSANRQEPPQARFVRWWFWLPLAILCLSRSRLPLYVLPLFAPAALMLARRAEQRGRLSLALALSILLFAAGVVLRDFIARWPTHRDARAEAASIAPWLSADTERIVFLGMSAHYGLRFYTGIPVVRAEGSDFLRFQGSNWMRESEVDPSRTLLVVGDNPQPQILAEAELRFRGARWLGWERVRCETKSLLCPEKSRFFDMPHDRRPSSGGSP